MMLDERRNKKSWYSFAEDVHVATCRLTSACKLQLELENTKRRIVLPVEFQSLIVAKTNSTYPSWTKDRQTKKILNAE